MGGLTSNPNRKRIGDSINSSSSSRYTIQSPYFNIDSQSDLHISKKLKLSPMHIIPESRPSLSAIITQPSTFTRIKRYPEPTKPLKTVHAPCRSSRFSRLGVGMGVLFSKVEEAKNVAVKSFKSVKYDADKSNEEEEEEEEVIVLEKRGRDKKKAAETEDDVFLKEKYRSFENVNDVQVSSSGVTDLSIETTPKSDSKGKTLGFVSSDCVVQEVDDELPYKRLFNDSAQKRDSRLGHFNFQISYLTKKLFSLRWSGKKQEKVQIPDPREETLAPLTDEEEAEVSQALAYSKRRKLLVTHTDSNIEITGEVLQCLRPGAWLNDEVINLYLELLKEREKREPKKFLKCHFFNTFFYKKLISGKGGYDFKSVRRWTTQRKIGYGLIECDKIFVPIHKEIHWCLAIINKREQKFQYLDSLKGRDTKVLQVLAKYYVDEVKDKSAKDIDVESWKFEYVSDLPAQENGFDCGMFMIKYADFYSRGLGLCFGQENMPYFRRRTAKEILKLKAD